MAERGARSARWHGIAAWLLRGLAAACFIFLGALLCLGSITSAWEGYDFFVNDDFTRFGYYTFIEAFGVVGTLMVMAGILFVCCRRSPARWLVLSIVGIAFIALLFLMHELLGGDPSIRGDDWLLVLMVLAPGATGFVLSRATGWVLRQVRGPDSQRPIPPPGDGRTMPHTVRPFLLDRPAVLAAALLVAALPMAAVTVGVIRDAT